MTPLRWILLSAFCLRIAFSLAVLGSGGSTEAFLRPDSAGYLALAESLWETGRFSGGDGPEIVRTPGYPLLLAGGVALGAPIVVAVVLQAFAGMLTVGLLFALGRESALSDRNACLAALLLSLDPLSILYAGRILSEVWFTLAFFVSLAAALRGWRRGHAGWVLFGGGMMGIAALIRPIALPLLPILGAAGFLFRSGAVREGVRLSLVWLLAGAVVLLPWVVRNGRTAEYWGVSAISSVNLYFYHGAAVEASRKGTSYYREQGEMGYGDWAQYVKKHPEQKEWSEARRYHFMRDEGLRILISEWRVAVPLHLRGVLRCLLDPGAAEVLRSFGLYPETGGMLGRLVDEGLAETLSGMYRERPLLFWTGLVMGALLALLLAASAIGTAVLMRRRPAGVGILLIAFVALLLLSGGPAALSRFRVPLMPFLCLFAGAGGGWLLKRLRQGGTRKNDDSLQVSAG